MSAAVPLPQLTRLTRARIAGSQLLARIDALNQQRATVERGAQPASAAASTAQSLRQQRSGVFARMLRLGRVDTSSTEVRALDEQLLTAEQVERQASGVLEAKNALIADIDAQYLALVTELKVATQELEEAQLEAATQEIQSSLMPKLRAAAEAMGDVYAELLGAGAAQIEMVKALRARYGTSCQGLGLEYPPRVLDLTPVGFGFTDTGSFNTLRIDLESRTQLAKASALARWKS